MATARAATYFWIERRRHGMGLTRIAGMHAEPGTYLIRVAGIAK